MIENIDFTGKEQLCSWGYSTLLRKEYQWSLYEITREQPIARSNESVFFLNLYNKHVWMGMVLADCYRESIRKKISPSYIFHGMCCIIHHSCKSALWSLQLLNDTSDSGPRVELGWHVTDEVEVGVWGPLNTESFPHVS